MLSWRSKPVKSRCIHDCVGYTCVRRNRGSAAALICRVEVQVISSSLYDLQIAVF